MISFDHINTHGISSHDKFVELMNTMGIIEAIEAGIYSIVETQFLKKLPKATHKEEGYDRLCLLKIMLRLFPINCMFLCVVQRSVRHHGFDGNVLLQCVSEEIPVFRFTSHTNFSDDVLINGAIKNSD